MLTAIIRFPLFIVSIILGIAVYYWWMAVYNQSFLIAREPFDTFVHWAIINSLGQKYPMIANIVTTTKGGGMLMAPTIAFVLRSVFWSLGSLGGLLFGRSKTQRLGALSVSPKKSVALRLVGLFALLAGVLLGGNKVAQYFASMNASVSGGQPTSVESEYRSQRVGLCSPSLEYACRAIGERCVNDTCVE